MPRSGTSMMMRMLAAGGMPILADQQRAADAHNPYGYFEDQRAVRLARDSAWLDEACGKVVKVIYRLLPQLPARFDYRVLLMQRDLSEVWESQQEMLRARGDTAAAQDREAMVKALGRDLEVVMEWVARQANFRWMAVPYAGLVAQPRAWVRPIGEFLGVALDEAAMVAAVDPALYHHKRG